MRKPCASPKRSSIRGCDRVRNPRVTRVRQVRECETRRGGDATMIICEDRSDHRSGKRSPAILRELIAAGVDVFRLNFYTAPTSRMRRPIARSVTRSPRWGGMSRSCRISAVRRSAPGRSRAARQFRCNLGRPCASPPAIRWERRRGFIRRSCRSSSPRTSATGCCWTMVGSNFASTSGAAVRS